MFLKELAFTSVSLLVGLLSCCKLNSLKDSNNSSVHFMVFLEHNSCYLVIGNTIFAVVEKERVALN